jgi:preprotein translocase subunit SecD
MRGNSGVKFIVVLLAIGILTYLTAFGAPAIGIPSVNEMRYGIDIRGGVNATIYPDLAEGQKATDDQLRQVKKIIDKRLESKGIFDKYVNIDDTYKRIVIEIPWKPGEKDHNPQKTIDEIGKTALLTFQEVDESKMGDNGKYLPTGKVIIEGKDIIDAIPTMDNETGGMAVSLKMNDTAKKSFAEATGRLVGKPIAIFMDDIEISHPVVNEPIVDGNAQISMGRGNSKESAEEARELADTIKAGALPFRMVAKNVNSISALLGEGAKDVTVYAGVVSFILVCLFMIAWYRLPGLIASIALFGLVVGQLVFLQIFKVSLTLPGIAGIILSVGMGVDANIIISARIREELKSGKTLRAAIDSGFKRAFSAILDANVTTIITAVILYWLGTGPIQGFAFTLGLGVMLSFVTAVTASRIMLQTAAGVEAAKHHWLYGA